MTRLAQVLPVNIGNAFDSPWGRSLTVGDLVSIVLQAAMVIAGVIVLFLFIGGGIQIIASSGKDDPQGAAKGKQAVTAAVIGFIIVFSAFWIIRVIETITGGTPITRSTY